MVLRMFGLFVAIPVLSLHASTLLELSAWMGDRPYTLSESGVWLGMVMGGYGLMQFLLQIPSGLLSDRFGRRPIIFYGLIIFITGSLVCELARDIQWLAFGRLLQGMGAVSAATTALLADLTSERTRVRWMAFMGVGISLSFIAGIVLGPKLYGWLHFKGFFLVPAYLSVISLVILSFFPTQEKRVATIEINTEGSDEGHGAHGELRERWHGKLLQILIHPQLLPLNAGVFFLHASMVGVFVAIPWVLNQFLSLSAGEQWRFYVWIVPATLIGAMLLIWPSQKALRFSDQKNSATKIQSPVMIPAMVFTLVVSLWGMSLDYSQPIVIIIGMVLFFLAFNVLEAMQPALVSFIAPLESKGAAMGVYHACQSLGLFVGGLISAWVFRVFDAGVVFRMNASLMALWLALAIFSYFQLAEKSRQ